MAIAVEYQTPDVPDPLSGGNVLGTLARRDRDKPILTPPMNYPIGKLGYTGPEISAASMTAWFGWHRTSLEQSNRGELEEVGRILEGLWLYGPESLVLTSAYDDKHPENNVIAASWMVPGSETKRITCTFSSVKKIYGPEKADVTIRLADRETGENFEGIEAAAHICALNPNIFSDFSLPEESGAYEYTVAIPLTLGTNIIYTEHGILCKGAYQPATGEKTFIIR